MIDDEVRRIVESKLMKNESLIWTGKPVRFPIEYDSIFGLFFVIFWILITFKNPDFPILFKLVGPVAFLAVVNAIIKPSRDAYGLTDRRGFVINRQFGNSIHFLSESDIRSVSLKKDTQIGTLKFNFKKFHNVEYPKKVLEIINKQILSNGAKS